MIGGFVKFVFSKGWLCIRLQCSINICVKFLTAGWYIVTEGNKSSWPSSFCVFVKADCVEEKLTPDKDLLLCFLDTLLLWGVVWISKGPLPKIFSRRASSKKSYCFAFNETIFYARWVARDEVRKLEGLGRLVMVFDVQDGMFCESFSFKHCGIEENNLSLHVHVYNLLQLCLTRRRTVYCTI